MGSISLPHSYRGMTAPTTAERFFAGTVLLLSSGAFLQLIQDEDTQTVGERGGALLSNVIWISIYIVTAYIILKHLKPAAISRFKVWHLLAILAVTCASALWSDDRTLTLIKAAAFLGTSVVSYYFAVRFTVSELLAILARVFLVSVALSFAFVFFLPAYGVGSGDFAGVWQGIYPHKNLLGTNMSLAFLVFSVLSLNQRRAVWVYRSAVGLSLLLVFLSQSVTSLMLCIFVAVCLIVRVLFRTHVKALLVGVALLLAIVLLTVGVPNNLDSAATALDRDPTLTGRTALWATVWLMIWDHPYLGYGYGAFWRGFEGPSAEVWKDSKFHPFYSHNGFLDVWLDLGMLGLGLVLASLLITFRAAFRIWRKAPTFEGSWPFLFLIYLLVSNLTEGSLLRINFLPWILYVSIAIQLSWVGVNNWNRGEMRSLCLA